MFEARRWHNDKRFYTPMIVLDCGEQLVVGDFVKLKTYNIIWKSDKVCIGGIIISLLILIIIDTIKINLLAEKVQK